MPNYFRANKKSSGGGANLQTKTITAGTSSQTVQPDSGFDGFSEVTVDPTPSQTKSVTATTSQQTVTPDSGKLLSSVTVNPQSHSGSSGTYTTNGQKDLGANHNIRYVNISVSGSLSQTELWVNPNPASSMSSSIISLNGHQFNYYKYIKLVFRGGTSSTGQSIESEVIMSLSEWQDTADSSGHPFLTASCRVGSYRVIRSFWINDNSSFHVGSGYNTGTQTTDNGACIPYKMIGLS